MRPLKTISHIALVALGVFLLGALPVLLGFDIFSSGRSEDTVSSASTVLPDQPSGDFVVLINTSLHEDTIDDWCDFFSGKELPVIFEDISCAVAEGDTAGLELTQRFLAQLPENQMRFHTEEPSLLVSKAEAGFIDVAVFSKEMAEALKLAPKEQLTGITMIELSGG